MGPSGCGHLQGWNQSLTSIILISKILVSVDKNPLSSHERYNDENINIR